MKVIADSHAAVFTNPLSSVTAPFLLRSFDMSIPCSPLLRGQVRVRAEVADGQGALCVCIHLVCLVAVGGQLRLASRHGWGTVGVLSVWSLALFPASFVFSMTYPSAIFLAASVWA